MKHALILSVLILCVAVTSWAQKAGADDGPLQQSVQRQLAADPAFAGVHAQAQDGKVTLTGSVATKNDRYHAEDMVKSVPGVTKVKNHLQVTTGEATSPSKPNPGGVAASTSPATSDSGSNSKAGQSAPQSSPSPQLIAWVQQPSDGGARLIYASLQEANAAPSQPNAPTAAQSRTSAGAAPNSLPAGPSDSALQSQIESGIRNDPSLSSSQISIRVSGDTIELSGSVPTGKEKLTAERLARSYSIDRKVVDDKLTVAGQSASAGTAPPTRQ